jgi:two-component system chemotaxis sensor kinase CheA
MTMQNREQFSSTFREEATERLAEMEEGLLELEERPDDAELIARIFRAMHTIKGSGAMFGFDDIASFTHEMETVFDRVRNGKIKASRELVGLALAGKDLIRAMLTGDFDPAVRERLITAFRSYNGSSDAKPVKAAPEVAAPPPAEDHSEQTFRIRFRPHPDLFLNGTNPACLLDELRELGRCELVAHSEGVPSLDELDPEQCYVWWDAVLITQKGENALRDVFMFVEDHADLRIEAIDRSNEPAEDKKLGQILVERGDLTPDQLQEALNSQKRIGELLREKGLVSNSVVQSAALEQKVVREVRQQREAARGEGSSSIRVASGKVDTLVNLVGELVIAQARLAQVAGRVDDLELVSISEDIERLSGELRDNTLNIRMVPIGTTFSRFKRLVRDLSTELGKEIDLITEGAETELDKTVIEQLGDPLVHVIRNSCDHGIEEPATRVAAGKTARGTLRLSAYQSGPSVVVEVRDDGAGLRAEAIRTKAIERGLLSPDAHPTEKELFSLILLPGFSTAATVSNLSGRGVGMDVVKRAIDALHGELEVDSAVGQGTTIRFRLPLTLAIIEGLLVAVGDGRYVLPMSLVEECVELTAQDVTNAHGNHLAAVRGELVPYLRLRDWFGEPGARPPIEQIAIATIDGIRFGFVVDGVVGQLQTVIKTLGKMYREARGLSGATILGDGTVALIVDVPTLMRTAQVDTLRDSASRASAAPEASTLR